MRNSILFVNPAYHYSFVLRDELRRLGWRADVYKNRYYPELLLYADDALTDEGLTSTLKRALFFFKLLVRYQYFVVYGDAEVFPISRDPGSRLVRWLTRRFKSPEMHLLTLLGRKILFFPNGCHQEVLKRDFAKHEGGRVCANCVMPESVCNDKDNQAVFDLVNAYHSLVIANTPMVSVSLPQKRQIRFVSLDLEKYGPKLQVGERHRLSSSGRLKILHSFVEEGRQLGDKNIKGSPYVRAALDRLKREGFPVEYFYLSKIPSREMRYYQAQADIVVDQLVYGWWGSTAIECMGLGKPVVCYLNEGLKSKFFDAFPEYEGLPIIEATTDNIYEVLKRLVEDPAYRIRKGDESRQFALKHFDVKRNAPDFVRLLLSL